MTLKLLLELLGGVRATIFLMLFLGTAVALGITSYKKGNLEDALAAKETAMQLDKAKYEAWMLGIAKTHSEAITAIENKLRGENEDAQKELDALNLARSNGTLVLRDRFKCPIFAPGTSTTVPSIPGHNGTSYAVISPEDEEFLISEAKRADDYARRLNAAQDVIRSYEKALGVKRK